MAYWFASFGHFKNFKNGNKLSELITEGKELGERAQNAEQKGVVRHQLPQREDIERRLEG